MNEASSVALAAYGPNHGTVQAVERIWYASYGSNMSADRFACYLSGGSLPGMSRTYPGARDRRPASDSRGVRLRGQIYFALESVVWGGGMAFLDPDGPGEAAGRGYLITVEQFADVVDQEMHREPTGRSFDVDGVLAAGRLQLGPGRYETIVAVGGIAGVPVLTFTSPVPQRPLNAPSAGYVRMLAAGLSEAHDWNTAAVAAYLAALPGVGHDAGTLEQWITAIPAW